MSLAPAALAAAPAAAATCPAASRAGRLYAAAPLTARRSRRGGARLLPCCHAAPPPSSLAASAPEELASRRAALLHTAAALAAAAMPLPALADDDLVQFYGAANPPATPGKVGGVEKARARYGFQVPPSWTEEVISKVEKGTNGTDVRFLGPARKKEQVFVLTLLNYGGKQGFTMDQKPVDLLKSLTGSLFFFQDALQEGELTAKAITKNGARFFEYELRGPSSYLIQLTVTDGRVFGFFVTANARSFDGDQALLRAMLDSFATFANVPGGDDRA